MIQRLLGIYDWWVRRVRRITTSGEIIPEIDGLRFLAIGGVFLHHVVRFLPGNPHGSTIDPLPMDTAGRIADAGAYGVQLFFIISGFILGLPFASQYLKGATPVSLRKYYLRRVTRLEPPYLAAMLMCFGLSIWVGGESAGELLPHLLASLAYSHNWIYSTFSKVNPVAWSLEIEVQFYVAAPLLASIFAIRGRVPRRLALLGSIAAIMALQTQLVGDGSRLYYSLAGFIHFFLAGFLLADIYVTDWAGAPARTVGYDVAMLGCTAAAAFLGAGRALAVGQLPRPLTHALALLVLFFPAVAAFRSLYFRRLMGHSLLVSIGGMCYTIYLLHHFLMHLLAQYTRDLAVTRSMSVNVMVYTAIYGLPILLISTLFYLAIEKPCMRKDWPRRLYRYLRSWRPTAPSNSPSLVGTQPVSMEEPGR